MSEARVNYSEAVDAHIYCAPEHGCETQEDWKLLALAALDQGGVPGPTIDAVAGLLEMEFRKGEVPPWMSGCNCAPPHYAIYDNGTEREAT